MKIGLSLSFCIGDIVAGRESLDNMVCLVNGTNAQTDEEWAYLVRQYTDTYWRANPTLAIEIVAKLREQGRIVQPRTFGMDYPNVSSGHWIEIGNSFNQDVRLVSR